MPLNVYLNFNGNCRDAVLYYAQVFKLEKPSISTFDDLPNESGKEQDEHIKKLVLHAKITIGGTDVMFSDVFPGMPFTEGNNVSLTYTSKDKAEIEQLFQQLSDGGSVEMPLQETFWSASYGMLTDRFGIHWMLGLE